MSDSDGPEKHRKDSRPSKRRIQVIVRAACPRRRKPIFVLLEGLNTGWGECLMGYCMMGYRLVGGLVDRAFGDENLGWGSQNETGCCWRRSDKKWRRRSECSCGKCNISSRAQAIMLESPTEGENNILTGRCC